MIKILDNIYSRIIQNTNMGRLGTSQISNSSSVTTGIYDLCIKRQDHALTTVWARRGTIWKSSLCCKQYTMSQSQMSGIQIKLSWSKTLHKSVWKPKNGFQTHSDQTNCLKTFCLKLIPVWISDNYSNFRNLNDRILALFVLVRLLNLSDFGRWVDPLDQPNVRICSDFWHL